MRLFSFTKSLHSRLFILIALSAGYSSHAQTITTFAGSGIAGYNGDDEPATATQLWSPAGIALSGNSVYIADGLNNRIRKVAIQRGAFSTVAGLDDPGGIGDGAPATDAQLNDPDGLAMDAGGNTYIADKYNNRVRKITPKGIISAFAGNGEAGYSGDGGPATAGQLNAPAGITVDKTGNVYIVDAGNNCIREVTVKGNIITIAGTGSAGYQGNGGPATAAQLNGPKSVAIDTAGNLYIADALNYTVRKVTPAGVISTFAGNDTAGYTGDEAAATAAKLNVPSGLATDKSGNLFIADLGNNCIRKITPDGNICTIAGGGSAGGLNSPLGIAVDGAGNLYVTEPGENLVKRVIPAPAKSITKTNTKTKTAAGKGYTPPPLQTTPFNSGGGGYQLQTSPPVQSAPSPAPAQTRQTHGRNNG